MYIPDINAYMKPTEGKNSYSARVFNHFLTRLFLLAKSVFNWTDLPAEIPEQKLEEILLFHGKAVFFKDDVTNDFIALPYTFNGTLNMYGLPNAVRAYGLNGYNYNIDLKKKEGVLIFDNYNLYPLIQDLVLFAERMTSLLVTEDVNLAQQRVPIIFKSSKQAKSNIERALQKQQAGAYTVIADNNMTTDIAQPMYQPVPYIADKLQLQLEKIWADALTFIGIVNVDEKAERLNSFEVGSQIEEITSQLSSRLKPRREACTYINDIFGLNMDVIPSSWVFTRDRSTELGIGGFQDDGTQPLIEADEI